MPSETLIHIKSDMKTFMKSGQKENLSAVRLILSQVKQFEVDKRVEMTESDVNQLLSKMAKQSKDAIAQYTEAGREDLVKKESIDLEVIQSYLPQQLSDSEVEMAISKVLESFIDPSMKDMGKIMSELKTQLSGRADMSLVSQKLKSRLS